MDRLCGKHDAFYFLIFSFLLSTFLHSKNSRLTMRWAKCVPLQTIFPNCNIKSEIILSSTCRVESFPTMRIFTFNCGANV